MSNIQKLSTTVGAKKVRRVVAETPRAWGAKKRAARRAARRAGKAGKDARRFDARDV